MVVHPGREGVDARTELQALGLDGGGQVATLSLDGGGQVASLSLDGRHQVAALALDAGILSVDPSTLGVDPVALSVDPFALSVDPFALSVDPGGQTRPEGIDPGPKIEETAERSEDGSPEQPDRGLRHRLHRGLTVAPANDSQARAVHLPAGLRGSPLLCNGFRATLACFALRPAAGKGTGPRNGAGPRCFPPLQRLLLG